MSATYKENFESLIRIIAITDGVKNEEGIEGYIFAVNQRIEEWTFGELDEIYEEGLDENMSILTDELYAIAAGYALLFRYGLDEDEYQKWVQSQEDYQDYLLAIIGKELLEDYSSIETAFKSEEAFSILCEVLEDKHKLIKYVDCETGYTLFGKNIEINENVYSLADLFLKFDELQEFSLSILENGLKLRCPNYKECSKNIVSVLKDAVDAVWIKCRRYLNSLNVQNELINKIHQEYIDLSEESYVVKDHLDNALMQLKKVAEGKAEAIIAKDARRRDIEIQGGGFGIGGTIAGMIGARVFSAANSAWSDAKTRSSAEMLRQELEHTANEIYLGYSTKQLYKELIVAMAEELKRLCVAYLYDGSIEMPTNLEEIIKGLDSNIQEDRFSGEQLRIIAANMLFAYPWETDVYKCFATLFTDVQDELLKISRIFHLDISDEIEEWATACFGSDEECMVFQDVVLEKEGGKIKWDYLRYCNKKYHLEFESDFPIFNNNEVEMHCNQSFSENIVCLRKNGDILRIWGGEEGEDVYNNEIQQSSNQILKQVNGFPNVNITDFTQNVETKLTGEIFTQILRVELLYNNEKYDSFMLTYLDKDAFITVCFGNKNGMGEKTAYYYETIKRMKIFKSVDKVTTRFSFMCSNEVVEELQKDAKKRAVEYYESHWEEIDLEEALSFRKRFKALMNGTEHASNTINKYHYEIRDKDILEILSVEEHKGQYVLYYSKQLMITDYYLFIWDKKQNIHKFLINEIIEILPIESYFMGTFMGVYVRKIDGNGVKLYLSEKHIDEIVFLSDVLNISLDFEKESKGISYYRVIRDKKQPEHIYCSRCGKIAESKDEDSLLIRNVFCKNCGAERKYIYRISYNKDFVELINGFDNKYSEAEKQKLFLLEESDDYRVKIERKKEYVKQETEILQNKNINQVIIQGCELCGKKEYFKAQKLFEKRLNNEPYAVALLNAFFQVDKASIILNLLRQYIGYYDYVDDKTYTDAMSIFARMINREDKTLLIYAAEARERKLIDELIKYDADVERLYKLLGKTEVSCDKDSKKAEAEENVIVCKSCGKKLKSNAKFCNFCGQRVE